MAFFLSKRTANKIFTAKRIMPLLPEYLRVGVML